MRSHFDRVLVSVLLSLTATAAAGESNTQPRASVPEGVALEASQKAPADLDGNAMIFDVGAWGGSGITLYRNNGGFRFMLPGGLARGDCIFPKCQARTWYHLVCVWTGDGALRERPTRGPSAR